MSRSKVYHKSGSQESLLQHTKFCKSASVMTMANTMDGGAMLSAGGTYSLGGRIGQFDAGTQKVEWRAVHVERRVLG
jgi:hypothetical protein